MPVTGVWRRALVPALGLVLFAVALGVLHRELAAYHLHDVLSYLEALPAGRLLAALALTAASYLAAGYDLLGLKLLGRRLPYRRVALAASTAMAIGNNMGHSLLTGGSIRYRLYTGWGLATAEVATLVAFCDLALWLGYFALAGVALLLAPPALPAALHLPVATARPLGALFLSAVGLYFAGSARRREPIRLRGWEVPVPPAGLSLAGLAVAALDWTATAAALRALLPPLPGLGFPGYLAVYLLAHSAAMASQVPAGLGVFEGAMLLLLRGRAPGAALLGGLLAFRAVYYLAPLAVATVALGAGELVRGRHRARKVAASMGRWAPLVVPQVFAVSTFVAGVVLLLSGATPASGERLRWLQDFVPLPVLEVSHFLGSLAGVGLILLARGLQRRLDGAYLLATGLLGAGIVASLLKGFDYEEALLLALMLAALLPCRRQFYRHASLLGQRFTAGWIAAIVLILLGTVWLVLFSYKHVDYSHDLWWRFAFRADAPRSLRATVGAIAAALVFALSRLLRTAPESPAPTAGAADLDHVAAIAAGSRRTSAYLALLGDKELLWSPSGRSFLMFGRSGRSWIALGGPVGEAAERSDLAWRFREECDRNGVWPVLYQVDPEDLPLCLDLGLALQKLGEEARVPLGRFTLAGGGKDKKGLRNAVNRAQREGCRFEIVPPAGFAAISPELEEVSDLWLAEKATREKGFSLGFWNPGYLGRFPQALVRRGGRIEAFANLWPGAGREELSVDLMRFRPDAPAGTMEYLFVELLLYGQAEGYAWFSLGMAPLSGLQSRALAPLWSRLGGLVFRHGEGFYNFQGLRQYKEKFDPVWEPRYLASPGGVALPRVLADLSALIAGGFKGVFKK